MDFKYELKKRIEKFYWWLIRNVLPKKLILFCFVSVYGTDGEAPSSEYSTKYDFWCIEHNIR